MAVLSEEEIGISLLRVSPGQEIAVVNEWAGRVQRARSQRDTSIPAQLYLTLGRSDIAVIHERNVDVGSPELWISSLPGVVCEKQLDCYVWDTGTSVRNVLRKKVCALIFMRMNPDLWDNTSKMWNSSQVDDCEVGLELALADHIKGWSANHSSVLIAMLGSFGRDGTLVMLGADDLDALLLTGEKFIQDCSAIVDDEKPIPAIRETYTTVGVVPPWEKPDFDLELLRGMYPLRRPREDCADTTNRACGANVRIELRCCASDVNRAGGYARSYWGDIVKEQRDESDAEAEVAMAYGPADISIGFPLASYGSFGDLVTDLHLFRRECAAAVMTSECQLELPIVEGEGESDGDGEEPPRFLDDLQPGAVNVELTSEDAERILAIDEEALAILHCLHSFNHRLRDDGGEAIRDLLPHYDECRIRALEIANQLNESAPSLVRDDLRHLYLMLEEGQIGQIQRLEVFPMSRRVGTDLGPYRSGIRRRLWAAQAVPDFLLNTLLRNSHWNGFVIGGRLRDAFHIKPPIMNVPAQDLQHPENWWVLTHEAMHDFVDRLNAELDGLLNEIRDGFWAADNSHCEVCRNDYFEEKVIECVADMLEYLSLGSMDWREHQRITWRYVLRNLPFDSKSPKECYPIIGEHLLRCICAVRCASTRGSGDTEHRWSISKTKHWGDYEYLPGEVARENASLQVKRINETIEGEISSLLSELTAEVITPAAKPTPITAPDMLGFIRDDKAFRGLVTRVSLCTPIVGWVVARKHYFFDSEVMRFRDEWRELEYKSCKEEVEHGRLVKPNVLKYPDLFVWGLQRDFYDEPMPSRMANAVTLSLAGFYLHSMNKRLGSQAVPFEEGRH